MTMAFNGLAKLSEEVNEVGQVCGKVFGVGSLDAFHWSGNLRDMLHDEIGDVLAAIAFVVHREGLDVNRIGKRQFEKLALYEEWDKEND